MGNKLLYIGLNGLAGSGKDTVAKMLKTILMQEWDNLEECKKYYKTIYTNPTISATFNTESEYNKLPVMCIAYADQLKYICANIFGIPVERFYMNKSNAWICLNQNFQYTEIRPDDNIVTAEEYYYSMDNYNQSDAKVWMSLRDILVYVGTYVLQQTVNKNIFVNIVRNKVDVVSRINHKLNYVIVTDNRFCHEMDFIRKEKNGITMTITRDTVKQLDNIAEHDLDNEENYDFIVENNEGYDELFDKVWNIVHDNIEFKNITVDLLCRDNVNNYLRLIDKTDDEDVYMLCAPMKVQKTFHSDGEITMIDPVGGPTICINQPIQCENTDMLIPSKIEFDSDINQFLIYVKN